MNISFTRVTWYSQIIAIILFVGVFILGIYLGSAKARSRMIPTATDIYVCSGSQAVTASYYPERVSLILSDKRSMDLPQARSASGARYATLDESFVFWNKGNNAFIEERGVTTYKDCVGK